ncbi:MAG: hypothetical protein J7L55_03390, partial [Desulfurococcales archaeon]|nr:hypothetical protein [Desulfurococcales archaeon]
AAELYDLQFIKLSDETYDLAIHKESINKPVINALIELMKSQQFKNLISKFPGYRECGDTGEVIHDPINL